MREERTTRAQEIAEKRRLADKVVQWRKLERRIHSSGRKLERPTSLIQFTVKGRSTTSQTESACGCACAYEEVCELFVCVCVYARERGCLKPAT